MTKKSLLTFLLMHFGFLIYSGYVLAGKFASNFEFLSFNYCLLYGLIIFILFVYAIIWQQVLKHFKLSFAICNKAITIVWGMIFSALIFSEEITMKKIAGALVILAGILLLSFNNNDSSSKTQTEQEATR